MKLPHRRRFLHLAASAAALPVRASDRAGANLSDATGAYPCWLNTSLLKTRSRAPPEFRVVHPTKKGGRFDYPLHA